MRPCVSTSSHTVASITKANGRRHSGVGQASGQEDAIDPDIPATFGGHILRREAARWWSAPLVGAVIWFVIAWLVLRADYSSVATVGVILGVAFLIAAVNEVALAAVIGGGWAAVARRVLR